MGGRWAEVVGIVGEKGKEVLERRGQRLKGAGGAQQHWGQAQGDRRRGCRHSGSVDYRGKKWVGAPLLLLSLSSSEGGRFKMIFQ